MSVSSPVRITKEATAVLAFTTPSARTSRVSPTGKSSVRLAAMPESVATRSSSNSCTRARSVISCATMHRDSLPSRRIILALAHIVVLSFPNTPHVCVDARPIVSDDVVERHVPKFFLRVAERFLKSGVGFHDAFGFSVDQTYVLRGLLDHRAVELLALLERLLGPLTLGDVTDCGHPYGMSLVRKHLPPNL